jgi:hypothetical protein
VSSFHASPAAPGCDRKKKQARTRVRRALGERQKVEKSLVRHASSRR